MKHLRRFVRWLIETFERYSLAVAVLAVLAAPAHATTYVVPQPEAMLNSADAVVLGRVESIRSVAKPDGSGITTEIAIRVQENLKGATPGEMLTVREIGGRVGDLSQWIDSSPAYRVGETALVLLQQKRDGSLRTQHLGLGRIPAEVKPNGAVFVRPIRPGRGRVRQSLPSFAAKIPLSARKAPRVAQRAAVAPALVGKAASLNTFSPATAAATNDWRLLQPASRWFTFPVQVFGATVGDAKLGFEQSRLAAGAAARAWHAQPGSMLTTRYAGERAPKGFVCNTPDVSVSLNDPLDQVADPSGGAGVVAIGGFCSSGSTFGGTPYQKIMAAAVVVNNGWGSNPGWTRDNVAEVIAHEIGHTIGFAHACEIGETPCSADRQDTTMAAWLHWDGRGRESATMLRPYDRGVLAYLYVGQSAPTPTPKPTVAPNPTATPRAGTSTLAATATLARRNNGNTVVLVNGTLSPSIAGKLTNLAFGVVDPPSGAMFFVNVPVERLGRQTKVADGMMTARVRTVRGSSVVSLRHDGKVPAVAGLIGEKALTVHVVANGALASDAVSCITKVFAHDAKATCR